MHFDFEMRSPEGASVLLVEIQPGGFRAVEGRGELWQVGNRRVDSHVARGVAVEQQLERHRSLPAREKRKKEKISFGTAEFTLSLPPSIRSCGRIPTNRPTYLVVEQ